MAQIPNEELLKRIGEKFGEQVTLVGEPYGLLTVETSRGQIIDLLTFLKTTRPLSLYF
jgi:NADH-quinone oxidoreductase subunit C